MKNIKNFFKKYLKFPDECVIIDRLTSDATKREVAIAPIFPRRLWGISAEQVWSKNQAKVEENKEPFLGTARCAA